MQAVPRMGDPEVEPHERIATCPAGCVMGERLWMGQERQRKHNKEHGVNGTVCQGDAEQRSCTAHYHTKVHTHDKHEEIIIHREVTDVEHGEDCGCEGNAAIVAKEPLRHMLDQTAKE